MITSCGKLLKNENEKLYNGQLIEQFFSLTQLNKTIAELLVNPNSKAFKKLLGNRKKLLTPCNASP